MKKQIMTRRQDEAYDLIMKGLNNVEIAEAMGISEKGVKWHKTNLFRHFNVKSTNALICKQMVQKREDR